MAKKYRIASGKRKTNVFEKDFSTMKEAKEMLGYAKRIRPGMSKKYKYRIIKL